MRRLIIVVSALLLAGCGSVPAATSSPYAPPTPDHRASVQTIKPKAVALNYAAKSLADAYTRRDVAAIRTQLPNIHDKANALNDVVFATRPTPPELTSAQEDCLKAATDGRELAGEWDDAIQRGDLEYLRHVIHAELPVADAEMVVTLGERPCRTPSAVRRAEG
jgi:hypothetical protein